MAQRAGKGNTHNFDVAARASVMANYYETRHEVDGKRADRRAANKKFEDGCKKQVNGAVAKLKENGMKVADLENGYRAHCMRLAVDNAPNDEAREKAQHELNNFLATQAESIVSALDGYDDVKKDKNGQLDFNDLIKAGEEARAAADKHAATAQDHEEG